jgi:hypothetical protein
MSGAGSLQESRMGASPYVSHETFPEQGQLYGCMVDVVFHYDTDRKVKGVVIRDDKTAPHTMLIALQDGRVINATECQFQRTETTGGELAHGSHKIFTAMGAKMLAAYFERNRKS